MIRLLILSPLLFAACENINSEDIATEDITANYTVSHVNANASSSVTVELKQGTSYVDLDGADILRSYSSVNSSKVYLRRSTDLFNTITYQANVEGGNTTGDTFTVTFERGSTQSNAPNSTVSMAPPISALSVIPNDTLDRNKQAISLSWLASTSDPKEPLTLSVLGTCINEINDREITDDGDYLIPVRSLVYTYHQINNDPESAEDYVTLTDTDSCEITVALTRTTTGDLDSHFSTGTFIGQQTGRISLSSIYTQ